GLTCSGPRSRGLALILTYKEDQRCRRMLLNLCSQHCCVSCCLVPCYSQQAAAIFTRAQAPRIMVPRKLPLQKGIQSYLSHRQRDAGLAGSIHPVILRDSFASDTLLHKAYRERVSLQQVTQYLQEEGVQTIRRHFRKVVAGY